MPAVIDLVPKDCGSSPISSGTNFPQDCRLATGRLPALFYAFENSLLRGVGRDPLRITTAIDAPLERLALRIHAWLGWQEQFAFIEVAQMLTLALWTQASPLVSAIRRTARLSISAAGSAGGRGGVSFASLGWGASAGLRVSTKLS
jgi:hypothetical protein